MYEDLREKAIEKIEKERKTKRAVHIVGLIFSFVAVILVVISTQVHNPAGAFWIRFPILLLALVYSLIYAANFGIPFLSSDDDLTEEEIEREIVKIYRKTNLNKVATNSANDENHLDLQDLRELEEIRSKHDDGSEFV